MRSSQLFVLFAVSASTSASVGPFVGFASAVGKTFSGLIGAPALPVGVLFPLAMVGSLKALVGLKTFALMKLLPPNTPLPSEVIVANIGLSHIRSMLYRGAGRPIGAQGAAAAADAAAANERLESFQQDVIPASLLLSQPMPEAVPQPDTPAAPISESLNRKRRDAPTNDATITDGLIREAFEVIQSRDLDHCVRRSICAIAVQPSLAGIHGSEVVAALKSLRDDFSAPWQIYKESAIFGEATHSHEACAQEFPSCTKDIETLISDAAQQLD